MRVLYVTGACLFNNTSANMSHNAYVQGIVDNGADVDIIMASDSWGEIDSKFSRQRAVNYYIYNSLSFADRVRSKGRNLIGPDGTKPVMDKSDNKTDSLDTNLRRAVKAKFRGTVKKAFFALFKPDPVYPLNKTWLKKARRFKDDAGYDLVVSNSSPAAGHRLVADLLDRNRLKTKRWIQIWEDPWYYDLYGGKSDMVLEEEHSLLKKAQEILYVSPLTLKYQQEYFPDCADKMGVIPLPAFSFSDTSENNGGLSSFGYFGDYYSHVRNLLPFYDALVGSGFTGYIFGDSNLSLPSTDLVTVSGRVTLDVLEGIQNKTSVLVHLCNLRGGQIPGKIYHYSATTKPILFILDGTEEEKKLIWDYFERFGRYYFCDNTKDSILNAFRQITEDKDKVFTPVHAFSPKEVVKHFL